MKKTLVALAVAAFATSASAVTVYDNEGTKVDIKGSARLLLEKSKAKRADLTNDGSRVEFDFSHKLNDDTKVVAYARTMLGDTVTTSRLYAGFDSAAAGKVTFGNQDVSTNGLDVSDFGVKYGGVSEVTGSGKKAVNYASPKFGGFSFGAHYLLGNADKSKTAEDHKEYNNGFGGALKFNQDLGAVKFTANAGFTQENYKTNTWGNVKRNAFIVSSGVENDQFGFGVTFTQAKTSKKVDYITHKFAGEDGAELKLPLNKLTGFGVGAKVNVTKENKIYGHFARQTGNNVAKTIKVRGNHFVVGTTYQFHKQAMTFVEYGTSKWKSNGKTYPRDNKVGVGLRVFF